MAAAPELAAALPRLGFLGVGWIGFQRMAALAAAGAGQVVAVADVSAANRERAAGVLGPGIRLGASLEEILDGAALDGLVIATPSALHARQACAALERGIAVFCQKPLARTQAEAAAVVAAARRHDRLIDVDFCYRTLTAAARLKSVLEAGELGPVYAAELVFHNAYGPDKPWFYALEQSGGGCVMDLGIHLADLLLWLLGRPSVLAVRSRLYAGGRRLPLPTGELEDFALAEVELEGGASARLACSWRAPAGCDAVIEVRLYGSRGAAVLHNVGGSFYDFALDLCRGTRTENLVHPPDDWGARSLCNWAARLARSRRFDPEAAELVEVAALVDALYGR